jgi:hypothetical protein
MSKTVNNQRNWKYHHLFKQAAANFKLYRADPVLSKDAMRLYQEDLNKLLDDSHFTKEETIKVSFREGFRRDSKAKLKVRNRRIEKRSSRQKAMIEVRYAVSEPIDE